MVLFKIVGCVIIFYLIGNSRDSEITLGSVVTFSVKTFGGAVTLSSMILGSLLMISSSP